MTMEFSTSLICWCGSEQFDQFSDDYVRCKECGSLVCKTNRVTLEELRVKRDERDFYGKNYWLSHQTQDYNHPDIYQRARQDLPERCLYWLKALLKYKFPPGKALELGSAYGGFVAMMRWAGFEAIGLEMSPSIVDFARQIFHIPMVVGPVEDQDFEGGSFDIIALMDVLEHLPDPVTTLRHCVEMLTPHGILLIQTPCFRGGNETYEKLLADNDPFVRVQLKEAEHLFLFTQESVQLLMERVGCPYLVFEPALFEYDMFFAVSRTPLPENSIEEVAEALLASPSGRLMLALLDLDEQKNKIKLKWDESEADRAARLEVISQLSEQLQASEADRAARLEVISQLSEQLQASEADRAARLEVIHQLSQQLQVSEADRAARLEVIQQQGAEIGQLHNQLDRVQRQWPVKILRRLGLIKVESANSSVPLEETALLNQPAQRETTKPPDEVEDIDFTFGEDTTPKLIYTLEDYVQTIEIFNAARPDMDSVRAYNHDMIDVLAKLRSLAGKELLDVGASPHGYALEWALQKGVSAYIGIGLGISETIEVQHKASVGKLVNMHAEDLAFEPETFDFIISLSTFEHFFDGAKVLQEMYRVLKAGGSVLIHFQPVWTASYGHHLHHIPPVAELIPPWAHLLWKEETMRRAYEGTWPEDTPMTLQEAIDWIYKSDEINRIDVATLRDMFYASDFEVEWMTPLIDDNSCDKPVIADYLSKILPYSADDLMTSGFSILLNKG